MPWCYTLVAIVSSVFPAALPLGTPALAGQLLIFETWQGSLVQQGHTAYDWAYTPSGWLCELVTLVLRLDLGCLGVTLSWL